MVNFPLAIQSPVRTIRYHTKFRKMNTICVFINIVFHDTISTFKRIKILSKDIVDREGNIKAMYSIDQRTLSYHQSLAKLMSMSSPTFHLVPF